MTTRRILLLAVASVLTLATYALVLVVTAFVACGISGCSGGGFGPSFAPVAAQGGLLVAGVVPLPLALLVLARARPRTRAAGSLAAVLAATVAAMLLLGLGPHGCPLSQSRATDNAGAATCSGDPELS